MLGNLMKQQTANRTMYNSNQSNETTDKNKTMNNSNQPNETTENRQQTKPCSTAISLMKQQTTNKTMNNKSQPNETTDNKQNHEQQQSN